MVGLAVAIWIFDFLRVQQLEVRFDPKLYGLAVTLSVALGALVGMLPALRSSRTNLTQWLKDGGQVSAGAKRHRARNFLVASQVGMAMILTVAAGVMTRGFIKLHSVEMGFDPEQVFAMEVRPRQDVYPNHDDRILYAERGLLALQETPGVESAAVSFSGFLSNWAMRERAKIQAHGNREEMDVETGGWFVSPNMLDMVGLNVIRGRGLSPDTSSPPAEALINERFANEYLKNENPIGQLVQIRNSETRLTIVGVTRDRSPLTSNFDAGPEIYANLRFANYYGHLSFLVRTQGNPKVVSASIRDVIRRLDRNQPVSQAKYVSDLIEEIASGPKSAMIFMSSLAGFGLLIALLGVYGVVAYSVMERTHEVGIRMAIGAEKRDVLWLLCRQGFRLLLIGGIPGLILAFGVIHGLPRQAMFHIDPRDPLTYTAIVLLVGTAGMLASFVPARKATLLKPMEALR